MTPFPAWPTCSKTPAGRGIQSNPLRLKGSPAFPTLGGPGRDLFRDRVPTWHQAFLSPLPPVLSMTDLGDTTVILDTRSVAPVTAGRARGARAPRQPGVLRLQDARAVVRDLGATAGPDADADAIGAAARRPGGAGSWSSAWATGISPWPCRATFRGSRVTTAKATPGAG